MNNLGDANLLIGANSTEPNSSANREIGEPADEPRSYWHSRGYLPHFESPDKIQHVTWHLADSLPKDALRRLEIELSQLPPDKQSAERRQRVQAWLDAGYGACILRKPEIAEMVQNSLLFFDGERYRMLAWVVMPNHVHTLFQPVGGWTVAKIVASWKKFTARRILDGSAERDGNQDARRDASGDARQDARRDARRDANQEIGVPSGEPIWHREYWDRFIRNERHLQSVVNYIDENPVKAGLVANVGDWVWSSAFANQYANRSANREIGVPGTPLQ